MDFDLTPEERSFKDGVTTWLKANKPDFGDGDENSRREWIDSRRAWQKKMFEAGFIGLNWPKEYGGKGATLMEQLLFSEALIETGAPSPINVLALGMLGPTLISQGSHQQKTRYLPKMLDADEIWCQGFSEPDAGSDLAALATGAVRDGDDWVITGQKVWNTYGQLADWCELLVRTDPTAGRHRGISCLIVDMGRPGIEVRPLRTATGDADFCELFFDKVRVPVSALLGPEGEGWMVAMATLTF